MSFQLVYVLLIVLLYVFLFMKFIYHFYDLVAQLVKLLSHTFAFLLFIAQLVLIILIG